MLIKYLTSLHHEIWNCNTEDLTGAEKDDRILWYGWLFEGTCADIQIPLWESSYTQEPGVLLNQTTCKVREAYLSEGIDIRRELHQPADYIGFELEFFLFLLSNGKPEKAQMFFREHLLLLLEKIFEAAARCSGDAYYKNLAQKTLQVCARLESLTEPDWSALASDDPGTAWDHFIPVSPEYAKDLLEDRTVKTAGRGNCGGACAICAKTAAGCVLSLESCDRSREPLTAPMCIRGRNYRGTYLSAARLRYPMLRVGKRGEGRFRRISWEEALDLLAEKIITLTGQYGPGCRYVNYSSGVSSVISGDYVLRRMFGLGGGYLGNFNSYSSACIFYTLPYIYGTAVTGSSLASFSDTKLAIFWGNNPAVTEHSEEWLRLIRQFKEHHTKVVLIDPHYNETGRILQAEWIPIRPDTDTALANAMAYVLWEEHLCDQDFMDRCCIGFDQAHMPEGMEQEESYKDYLFGIRDGIVKDPAWAEPITGIPAEKIRYLARLYADGPAAIFAGRGCQRNAGGEQNVRSITALACMMGYVGKKGGGTGYHCAVRQHQVPGYPLGDNPYRGRIPSFLWTDAVMDGSHMTRQKDHIEGREQLNSDIKLLFSLAGNTLLNQHSDIHRTESILEDPEKCEFIVVSDVFMTASARFADLLLPGTSMFEEEFITKPWGEGSYLLYGNRCIDPLFECRFEVDWILELADRLGIEGTAEGCESVSEWYRLIYNRVREKEPELPPYGIFQKNGGYRYRNNPESIAFEKEVQDPARYPFPTPSGRIEIFSERLRAFQEEEIPAVPKMIRAFEGVHDPLIRKYPLQVVGWHTKVRTHSVGDHNPFLQQAEPHRVWISSQDARERGIEDGTETEVFNDRGRIRIRAKVTDEIMPGVIGIPQGAWYTPDEKSVDIRGCVNTLTTSRPTALAKANPQHSCLADIRKVPE